MTAPATVLWHSADFDGIFCREIAKKYLPPDTTFIGWNFGDPLIELPTEGTVYILDLSPDCLENSKTVTAPYWDRIIWIDHHKTSIEKWPSTLAGYRMDGVAACRLAWQWFKHWVPDLHDGKGGINTYWERPTKQQFIDRDVSEPLAVRLAGEYDIWDKRDPAAEMLQYGLRCYEDLEWNLLLSHSAQGNLYTDRITNTGATVQRYAQGVDASICKHRTWVMEWEGLNFLCVNSARFNSLFFAAKDVPETNHNALLGFCFDGKGWTVSLYHAKHRTDIDLSVIAKKYGGGGHRGACGFTCKELPFKL